MLSFKSQTYDPAPTCRFKGILSTRARNEAETSRTELAKALLRLEALPRLEKEADSLREELKVEITQRYDAERDAAVFMEKSEGFERQLQRIPPLEADVRRESELRHAAEQSLVVSQQKCVLLDAQLQPLLA